MIESPKKLPEQAQPIAVEGRPSTVWWTYLFHLDNVVRKLLRAFYDALGDGPVLVADLPAAADLPGARRVVSDATATTFMSTVAGGGSNIVPVLSDGTNWKIG